MKIIRNILLTFFFFASYSFAQNTSTIIGNIKSGETPLEMVNVGIASINKGTYTDRNGNFEISEIPAGKYTLKASIIGYISKEKSIETKAGEKLILNFELEKTDINLKELQIIDDFTGLTNQTPYSVSRIDAKSIELKGNPSGLMGFLKEDPAVYGAEMGQGIVKPFIRGLGFSRVVTIYQGNKLENHQWGADHGLGLNDVGVGNVEIIKGPASILYGSGAIGGVILIKDNEYYLQKNTISGIVGATFNSVSNSYRPSISLGNSFKNGLFVATDLAYENHADYLDGSGRIVGNSRFNNQTYRFHAGLNKGNFKNKISYTFNNQNLGIIIDEEMIDSLSLKTTRNDRSTQLPFQKVSDHIISYKQSYTHNKWLTSLSVSHHINDRVEVEDEFDEIDLGLSQSHTFLNARASHRTNAILENNFGIQASRVQNNNKTAAKEILIPNASFIETALYYMANISLGKYFVQSGIRYDHRLINANAKAQNLIDYGYNLPGNPAEREINRTISGFTGSLGVSRKVKEKHLFKSNLSTGFRSPDLAELFSNGNHPGTNRFEEGDANFNREQSYQADINWIFDNKKFNSSLAFFGNVIDNYIYFANTNITNPEGSEVWRFLQTDAFLYGTELQINYIPDAAQRILLNATANLIRARDIGNDMNLTFAPSDNYSARVEYKALQNKKLRTFVATKLVDQQNRPGLNEESTPMYFLLNAGVNHEFEMEKNKISIGLSAFNILNRKYVDHMSILRAFNIPHAGRNIMLNFQMSF
jgi:iron complex outermembrane recepter protein